MEQSKRALYGPACSSTGLRFVPFAATTLGAWGKPARTLIRRLVRKTSLRQGIPPAECAPLIRDRLQAALVASVARQLARAFMEVDSPLGPEQASQADPAAALQDDADELPLSPPANHTDDDEAADQPARNDQMEEVDSTELPIRVTATPAQGLTFVRPPVAFRLLVRLPTGSAFPCTVDPHASVAELKELLWARCGLPRGELSNYGLALGYSALPEAQSLVEADVQGGHTLSLYSRSR